MCCKGKIKILEVTELEGNRTAKLKSFKEDLGGSHAANMESLDEGVWTCQGVKGMETQVRSNFYPIRNEAWVK